MATVHKPQRTRNVAEASRRVLDPLRRLRVYIRTYVTVEAAAVVLLFMAFCFWAGLFLDYGTFRFTGLVTTGFDWVQHQPFSWWWLRGLIVFLFMFLVFVLVFFKAILRLVARFADVSLALELERRFPKILGDRLITAIELANRRKVIEQGYSAEMVDETIVEAAERVEKLPIKQVFRWRRLYAMCFFVGVMTLGLYLTVAAAFCAVDSISRKEVSGAGFGQFNEVAGIWFERNILLQNTIWPRRSHLVIVEPVDASLRLGRDATPPNLRVRALEYVIADRSSDEGWRVLTWDDLRDKKKSPIGGEAAVAPSDWKVRDKDRNEKAVLTVDEVALLFAKFDVRKNVKNTRGETLPFTFAIADGSEEGWQALSWTELRGVYLNTLAHNENYDPKQLDLPTPWEAAQPTMAGAMGPLVKAMPAPAGAWAMPQDPERGYSVDEVVKAMENSANQNNPALGDVGNVLQFLDRLVDMRGTLDKVNQLDADGSKRRTMRRLKIPKEVIVEISGARSRKTLTLKPQGENEFTGEFGELKEKTPDAWEFSYRALGEDYATQYRTITIVPPPELNLLMREDRRPAYLYYRPGGLSDLTPEDIKGKKQPLETDKVSLMGGELVTIDCPAGTDLKLIGTANKELSGVSLFERKGDKRGAEINLPITVNGSKFEVTFTEVRQELSFEIEMRDRDKVKGVRKFKLKPTPDSEPSVNVSPAEWARKTKDGIMLTPRARVPFSGDIKDDTGLSQVRYVYTVAKVESSAILDVKALFASGGFPMMATEGGSLNALIFLTGAMDDYERTRNAQAPGSKDVQYWPVDPTKSIKRFADQLNDPANRPDEFLPRSKVEELLGKVQPSGHRGQLLLRDFKMKPDVLTRDLKPDEIIADFDLETAAKLLAPSGKPQQRYRVTLWVEATDTDLDSTKARDGADGPKVGTSKERFQLIIVAEEDLLIEIAKDEAKQSTEMNKMFDQLVDIQSKLAQLNLDLGSASLKPENLSPLSVRTESLEQTLESAHATTKDVLAKYQAIFDELKGNRIESNKIRIVANEIIKPLEDVDQFDFGETKDKIRALRAELDEYAKDPRFDETVARSKVAGNKARDQVQILIDKIRDVLQKMEKGIELNKVVEELRKIEQREQIQYDLIKQLKDREEARLLEEALKGTKP